MPVDTCRNPVSLFDLRTRELVIKSSEFFRSTRIILSYKLCYVRFNSATLI